MSVVGAAVEGARGGASSAPVVLQPSSARRSRPTTRFLPRRKNGFVPAPESGFVTHLAQLGDHVEKGDKLAIIADPFGNYLDSLESPAEGVVIGKQNIPLTQEGEAVYHIAYFSEPDTVAEHVELLQDNLLPPEQGPVL